MSYLVIGIVAFVVSTLTLFSGFGLGTLLMPAFAVFFPVDVAVAATAVVHMANNIFKVGLLYRHAERRVLVRFGVPAVVTAFVGAGLLAVLSQQEALLTWQRGGLAGEVSPIKLVMGLLILIFALIDLVPRFDKLRFDPRWLPAGGALSGFFGGLSGHQGALRAAFLVPLGLAPAAFAATQAVLATMVDASRLLIYGAAYFSGRMAGVSTREQWLLVGVATLCAFGGALLGRRLLSRVTVRAVRLLTGCLLLIVGMVLITGITFGEAQPDQARSVGGSTSETVATGRPEERPVSEQESDRMSDQGGALRILSLGDSYTIGEAVAEEERWPVQLAALLRERGLEVEPPHIIAATGWTTMDLEAALAAEEKLDPPYDLVTLLIGVNNQYQGRPLQEYRYGFSRLLRRATEMAGDDPLAVLVLSIPDYGVTPFARDRDPPSISAELARFNAANQEICLQADVPYVDITQFSLGAADAPALVAEDGLHPSGQMYAAWAEMALPSAEAALRRR